MQITRGVIRCAQKVCVYGPEGVGKSTLAAAFPDPVFIDTEGSTRQLDIARTDPPGSWGSLLAQVLYFQQNGGCKTLVIDTADWAEQLCIKAVCESAKKKSVEDFGYGKGFTRVAEEFLALLKALDGVIDRGIHVVLTAHARMRKFEQPDEMGGYDRWELKLSKSTAPLVKEWADMILFAQHKVYVVNVDGQGAQKGKNKAQGGKRVLYTSHHPCWDAKNRHGLSPELPLSFDSIAHCISDDLAKPEQPRQAKRPPERKATPKEETPPVPGPEAEEVSGDWPPTDEQPVFPSAEVDSRIDDRVRERMSVSKVTEEEIQATAADRGYVPRDMPVRDYPPDFIEGWLLACWDKIVEHIEKNVRDLPF